MDGENQEESLVEERVEEMVAFGGSNMMLIKRNAWFLKPISSFSPNIGSWTPSCCSLSTCIRRSLRVQFKGWVNPGKHWQQWIDKLKPMYKDLWKKVGIFDALNASTCKYERGRSSLFGVAMFWSGETNTFLFPWGEVTLTLEDVMILGGFSVLGEPVRTSEPLDGELGEVASQMMKELKKFNLTSYRKAEFAIWIKQYMEEGDGSEVEHIAFLSLWLSQFVLPASPHNTVGRHVIPIAIRLARGIMISIAPAVLASLYRDLRILKDHLVSDEKSGGASSLALWAPFSLLQLWIWERFLSLRLELDGGKKFRFSYVISLLELPNQFRWRPYAIGSDKDDGEWIFANGDDDKLRSFVQCTRCCELVGIDRIEHYCPHRVARQFGFDQGIPDFVPRADSTWEIAWETFDISDKNVMFYIVPRLFEPNVTLQYSIWWENVAKLLRKNGDEMKRKKCETTQQNRLLMCNNDKKKKENDDSKKTKKHGFLTATSNKKKKKMKMKKLQEIFDWSPTDCKEAEMELKIKKLKMEIVSIAARVRELESLVGVDTKPELVSAIS